MAEKVLQRAEIDEKYKWKLEDMYPSDEAWEKDFLNVYTLMNKLKGYQGRLSDGADALAECLETSDELSKYALKLFAYARMRRDEDNRNEKYQSMTDRAALMSSEAGEAAAFLAPELLALGYERVYELIEEKAELNKYRHFFDDLFREKEHTLTTAEEKILAATALLAENPSDIYDMWNNADVSFGKIVDEEGKQRELTHGNYISFLQSGEQSVRKSAFEAMYRQYKAYENTLAAAYSGNVKSDVFYSKCRKYTSAIEMSLSADNIDTKVYDNLISAIEKGLPALKRYLKLRRKVMKLDKLHLYDVYTPLVGEKNENIPYEKACQIVLEALAPLGEEYVEQLKEAFESGWIDVCENQGKTPGAYSWGSNDTHPYVLLNYQNTINDVFTLAHELGHAMHSFYTNNTQPEVYKNYRIFVAEVASTVNENLLMEYLLSKTEDEQMRAYLLNHKLEEIRTTVYRQTMFAEFEKQTHSRYESGEPLTASLLCDIYRELNKKYFAPESEIDDDIAYEWARIPHFYSSFYVYQYATGYSAAVALADKILRKESCAVEKYIEFLKSGSSDYPIELLKNAGVNLETAEPIERALESFSQALDEMEKILL